MRLKCRSIPCFSTFRTTSSLPRFEGMDLLVGLSRNKRLSADRMLCGAIKSLMTLPRLILVMMANLVGRAVRLLNGFRLVGRVPGWWRLGLTRLRRAGIRLCTLSGLERRVGCPMYWCRRIPRPVFRRRRKRAIWWGGVPFKFRRWWALILILFRFLTVICMGLW